MTQEHAVSTWLLFMGSSFEGPLLGLLELERAVRAELSATSALTSCGALLTISGSSSASSSGSSSMSCSGSRTSVSGVLGKKLFGADDCLSKRVLEEVEVGDTDGEAKKSWAPCELIGIDLTLRRGLRGCLSPEVLCLVGEAMKGGSGKSVATDGGNMPSLLTSLASEFSGSYVGVTGSSISV